MIFSLDMTIASATFVLILVATAVLWDYAGEKIAVEESRNDMETIARGAAAVLVETRGAPSGWTAQPFSTADISSLGLGESFLVLDPDKMSALASANYTVAKTLLGIIGRNHEFRLDISAWNGTDYALNTTAGLAPNISAAEIVRVERLALLDGAWARLALRLWKQCGEITC